MIRNCEQNAKATKKNGPGAVCRPVNKRSKSGGFRGAILGNFSFLIISVATLSYSANES